MEHLTALLAILFGMIISAISLFLPPEGEIDGSVLMLNGQVLVYAGSIFGVKIYIKDLLRRS